MRGSGLNLTRRKVLLSAGGASALALAGAVQAEGTAAVATPQGEEASLAKYAELTREQEIRVINLRDIEAEAEKILPPESFAYIAGGAGDEWTMRMNEEAFNDWVVEPSYLSGVLKPDLATSLLGERLSLPLIAAPMGAHGRVHALKEVPSAKGTSAVGALYVTTTSANLSMEEVAAAATGPKWYQIYFPADAGFAREQLQRARAAGYTAIVLTVDSTTFSNRERPIRLGIPSPDLGRGNMPNTPGLGPAAARFKTDLNWSDVAFCERESGLPVIIKGVLTAGMATEAVRRGCAAVWVSNHGGRGMDKLAPAISALPRVAAAVDGRVPIIIDSGFRRGQDVFEALALGASAIAIGRPVLYGLALGGSLGVQAVFQRLGAELEMVMQLAGTPDIAAITPEYVSRTRDVLPRCG